jgi:N-acetylglucosaminyl-diphospho-decaprenol L-rhamnosyltransferase
VNVPVRKAPAARPSLSIIVPHRDTLAALDRCVAALDRGCDGLDHELIVVDNGSRSEAVARIAPRRDGRVLRNETNRGFAAACNQAAITASGRYLLFLNSDAVVGPSSLSRMIDVLERDAALAGVAPLHRDAHGRTVSPARTWLGPMAQALGLLGCARARSPLSAEGPPVDDVPWVSAAALLVRARAFRMLGGFDEGYFFYEEDEDLGWRFAQRGYRVAVCRDAEVEHYGGLSAEEAGPWPVLALYAGQARFVRRRGGAVTEWIYRASTFAAVAAKTAKVRSIGYPASAVARAGPSRVLRLLCSRRMQVRIAEE